jgi:hypothetical protein
MTSGDDPTAGWSTIHPVASHASLVAGVTVSPTAVHLEYLLARHSCRNSSRSIRIVIPVPQLICRGHLQERQFVKSLTGGAGVFRVLTVPSPVSLPSFFLQRLVC